ncbi:MAG TPA: hypothetical protein VFS33_11570 [Gemmatimonadales bacterium]|nr:hypothetical protein [Gemmatimonadales bacterium]
MPIRPLPTAALSLLLALMLAGCRGRGPGDSGGAATGDDIGAKSAGSAPTNAAFEHRRPADTMPGSRIHDSSGGDTARH